MGTNKKIILDRLDNAELELLTSDIDYATEYLKEEGIDVATVRSSASIYMKKIRFTLTAMANKSEDQSLLEKAFSRLKSVIQENANQTSEGLRAMLTAKRPSLQYRKLENWTDDEIKDVLSDLDLLDFLEELDKQD